MRWPVLACALVLVALTAALDAQIVRLRLIPYVTGVPILTTDNAQTIINGQPAGTTFLIKTGTHRLDSISPRLGDTFVGEAGAILSGAKILPSASFTVTAGGFWQITGQTQTPGARAGECQLTLADNPAGTIAWATSYPGCDYPEELFRDGVRMVHLTTVAALAPGAWFFDYAADVIYVGDNPDGHVITTSVTTYAFNKTADFVTIRNLTIEQYASPAQYGCINAEDTFGWVVTDNVLQNCHSGGIRYGHDGQILRNLITRNGEIGIVGIGDRTLVEGNTVSYNNGAHFDAGWEGGGSKFVLSDGLVIRDNWWHHNEGPGLWADIDNINGLIEDNVVEDNDQMGIFWEISESAIIRNNTVSRNGLAYWVPERWGDGIVIAASPDVEVYGNVLTGNAGGIMAIQQARGSGIYGPHEIDNLYVHDNTVTMSAADDPGQPVWNGFLNDTADTTYYTSRNNRFLDNDYFCDNDLLYFTWNFTAYLTFAEWQGYGLDTASSSIAFDAAVTSGAITNTTQTTALTVSATANRLLLVGVLGDAVASVVTGVTYNAVAMTLVDEQNSVPGSLYTQHLYRLIAPASGTNNIVVSASTSTHLETFAASYTGVNQTAQPEVAAEQSGTANPYTMSLTTLTAGSWTAGFVNASVGLVDGTGFTTRTSDTTPVFTASLGDSASAISAPGLATLLVNGAGGLKQSQMVAFAPATSGAGGSATIF